ncbi:L-serine ammonia-lyase [Polycladidibacter stylochi]|uniref:L-serine ammonia-lyase n=1 Tax=Polycladidibacter stylochi TaxID=1807766 RepID=UPI000833045E|nr:L-serine ammonia-lyase [Pseudovibrio stylochi]
MFLSVFDIFKIGIGPSSSHTMGPMNAAYSFIEELEEGSHKWPGSKAPESIVVTLFGSLAWTGKGHATDKAIMLGLLGKTPQNIDPDKTPTLLASLMENKRIKLPNLPELTFDPVHHIIFDYETKMPGHANALKIEAFDGDGNLHLQQIYYSVGGGFILTQEQLDAQQKGTSPLVATQKKEKPKPYPFADAAQMLEMGQTSGKTIAQMKLANELVTQDPVEFEERLWQVWQVMHASIKRGLNSTGTLPGGLRVQRRAAQIKQQLDDERGTNMAMPHVSNDWLSVYAMAVNEENAAGGQVVTAPTNGAAGVIPATIKYYRDHCPGSTDEGIKTFLLTAAAIGGLIKTNASISGAEVGCQGEVGSAAAMAAAGLCAALGGTNEQIENAAEIALEHHLGMTCDPVKGLVQVPCIERNGLGAIKAVSAASLALRGNGFHFMPLDNCIEAMRQTGEEMSEKYKETSQGGLAVNHPEC